MNKEALRKELELALKSGIRPKQDKFIKEYTDARLAALDDGDVKHRYDKMYERMKEYFATKDPKELIAEFEAMGYEFEDIEPLDDGQEGKGLDDLKLLQLAADNIEDENLSIRERALAKEWWVEGYRFAKTALPVADGEGQKDELIKMQDAYIEFLELESTPFIQFAAIHGMEISKKVVETGKSHRTIIALLKTKIET